MPRRRRRQKIKFKIPFLDPGRPSSPYVKDSRWWIQRHEPLPPFGEGYKTLHRRGPDALAQMREQQLPQSIYCLLNPPPGPEPPEDSPRLEIQIVEEMRAHIAQGSQVVACRVVNGCVGDGLKPNLSNFEQREVVAKIFDPLYFYHNGEFDIAELADMEYCREVAAYRHLQREGVDGKLLPGYLGSFTLELPLTEEQKDILARHQGANHSLLRLPIPIRRVRLILMEKVEGQAMTFQLVFGDVASLPDSTRLDVIASTLEGYAQLYYHGIVHGDLAPRNVFLRDGSDQDPRSTESREKRLRFYRFVDLGLAYVLGEPFSAFPRQPPEETRPPNPIRLFWHVFESGAINMYYWLPQEMRNTEAFHRWMLRRWYGDARFEAIGAVPEPLADDKPWDTEKAMKNDAWPGSKTPDGKTDGHLGSLVAKATAVIPVIETARGKQQEALAQEKKAKTFSSSVPTATEGDTMNRSQGFW